MTTIIETERLILRTWKKEDAEAYFQINQDPKVIEFLRGPLTMEQVISKIELFYDASPFEEKKSEIFSQ